MSSPSDPPPEGLETGVRAARQRMGLTQDQAADLIGVNRGTFKAWDRGRRPRDPELLQVISEAFETPIPVLWPTDENPIAAESLRALRDLNAAKAADQAAHGQTETILECDAPKASAAADAWVAEQPAEATPPPLTGATPYGLHRQIEATFDGKHDVAPGATPPVRRRRRLLIPAVVSALAVAAAGTAIATAGGEDTPTRPATPVAQTGPTAAERERAAQQATLQQAAERGDYDRAISIAARLNDTATTTDLRQTAAGILARRARSAANRGDLALATSRLDKAEKRYGQVPEIEAVRRRIEAIKDAREKRAAARKRAAKKRAAARAKAAAAASRRTPSQPTAPPSSSAAPSTPSPAPSTPQPSPTPSPTPAPSGGGSGGGSKSGGGSSGGSSNETVDPGLF